MEATATVSPPRWYWIVSAVALLWMLFGVVALVMDLTMDEAALAAMSEAERQIYTGRPNWLLVAYAVAILSGLGGVIGLLMRKSWAIHLLALSLIAAIIQFGYVLFGMGPGRQHSRSVRRTTRAERSGRCSTIAPPTEIATSGRPLGFLWERSPDRERLLWERSPDRESKPVRDQEIAPTRHVAELHLAHERHAPGAQIGAAMLQF